MNTKHNEEINIATLNIFHENEKKANLFTARTMAIMALAGYFLCLLTMMGTFQYDSIVVDLVYYMGGGTACIIIAYVCYKKDGEGPALKYFMIVAMILSAGFCLAYNVYGQWLFFAIPIVVSCRYYDEKFTLLIAILTEVTMIAASILAVPEAFASNYFDIMEIADIPSGTTITVEGSLAQTLLEQGYVKRVDFVDYTLMRGATQTVFLVIVSAAAIMVSRHGRELVLLQAEDSKRDAERRKQLMLSQLRPHFLFNSLASISALCRRDPETARTGVEKIAAYMRTNIDSIGGDRMVSFSDELKHTENYLWLEKMRFGERLKVEYDIKCKDFEIPAVSLQPLAEMAVKLGIVKKPEGGTIRISTYETDQARVILVEDDGAGYDVKAATYDIDTTPVGVYHIRERLKRYCGGTLDIDSVMGRGTKVKVTIMKEGSHN